MDVLSEGGFIREGDQRLEDIRLNSLRAFLSSHGWTRDAIERWIEEHRECLVEQKPIQRRRGGKDA